MGINIVFENSWKVGMKTLEKISFFPICVSIDMKNSIYLISLTLFKIEKRKICLIPTFSKYISLTDFHLS